MSFRRAISRITLSSLQGQRLHRFPLPDRFTLCLAWIPRNVATRPALVEFDRYTEENDGDLMQACLRARHPCSGVLGAVCHSALYQFGTSRVQSRPAWLHGPHGVFAYWVILFFPWMVR